MAATPARVRVLADRKGLSYTTTAQAEFNPQLLGLYLGLVTMTRTQDLWVQVNIPQIFGTENSNWARPIGFNGAAMLAAGFTGISVIPQSPSTAAASGTAASAAATTGGAGGAAGTGAASTGSGAAPADPDRVPALRVRARPAPAAQAAPAPRARQRAPVPPHRRPAPGPGSRSASPSPK